MKKPTLLKAKKHFARVIVALSVVFALSLSVLSITSNAASLLQETVPITLRSARTSFFGSLSDEGVTYVPLRAFAEDCANASVEWSNKERTATVTAPGLLISVIEGNNYIDANGRILYWDGEPIYLENGRVFLPVRVISRALGFNVQWNSSSRTVALSGFPNPIEPASSFYDPDELYWLSRIINAEAGGTEPLIGMIAVGNVVLNRVKDDSAPDTVYDVIFDNRFGVQFTPAYTSAIYQEPNQNSVLAAKIVLDGFSVSDRALYFYAPKYVYATWIENNREYLFTIGGHKFFA